MSDIDTDIGYHPILSLILTLISGNAGPDIGYPDIGPDIDPDIGYTVYDIGDMITRYRGASDMTRYRVTRKTLYRDM